jgi:sterol desaturase/sphingolipid hydroxylase (fatty acid hydroxylase superfamily)
MEQEQVLQFLNPRIFGFALSAIATSPHDASQWTSPLSPILWATIITLGLSLLGQLVLAFGSFCSNGRQILERGLPLKLFQTTDKAYIAFNNLVTALFTYHMVRYCALSGSFPIGSISTTGVTIKSPFEFAITTNEIPHILGDLINKSSNLLSISSIDTFLSVLYIIFSTICLFLVYDVTYMPFHWLLHHPSIYVYIHKHHHRSAAPHRGSLDAVNVHPFEFSMGEYNHLFSTHVISLLFAMFGLPSLHPVSVLLFVILGGVFASLNHTRFDVRFPPFFRVAWHDLHHHRFANNYGQYTMLMDYLCGTFLDAPEDNNNKRK